MALVGCGRWGRHILRDLIALGCEVPVVARSEASIERAREGGAAEIVADIASLGAVDGVVVATPTSTHAEVVEEALGLGAPVFVEKPLTADVDSARRVAAIAPDRLFVMDKWRYHPGVRELARIAQSGELGPVVGIHCPPGRRSATDTATSTPSGSSPRTTSRSRSTCWERCPSRALPCRSWWAGSSRA